MVKKIFFILTTVIIAHAFSANAQHPNKLTTIHGVVRDSITQEPMPFVAIFLKGSDQGTMTEEDGTFSISTSVNFISLNLSIMGYEKKEVFVTKGEDNDVTIDIVPTGVHLNELVVKPKREKYKKKGNPAVEFVEKVMAKKRTYDPKNHDYYSFDKYNKMTFGLNNFSKEADKNWITRKFKFLINRMDTSEVSGKIILPMSVKESISREMYRRNPASHKEHVTGLKRAGIDEIFDEESIQRFLDDVFREIDIFSNDITFMQNRFVSPLSNIGTNFYKYYLNDTINIDGVPCVDLSFTPHTSEAFGFTGRIYVPVGDTTMFVKKVKLNVPHDINLNYVQKIYIEQDYQKAPDGSRLKTKDDMTVEFQVMPATQELYARRMTLYNHHSFEQPSDLAIFSKEGEKVIEDDASYMPDEFWNDNRQAPIKKNENSIKTLLADLRQVPMFYWGEKVIVTLVSGYLRTGENSKFDFGLMNTTISGNSLEGARFRVGGMTTANLNKRLFARGYAAYGLRDEKMKYGGQLEYSFVDKKYHSLEFPINSIRVMHEYDVDRLGQHYLYTSADNVFLALKRKEDNLMTYRRRSEAEYKLETKSGFSFAFNIRNDIQEKSRFLPFVKGNGEVCNHYSQTSANLTLRYAPGEKFYETKSARIPINLDNPIFTLSHTYSPKGFMGNMFEINKTELGVQKRFWFSAFGYTDIILKAGKIWSEVSYPDLLLPNANLSYTVQPESYSLMNPMEFVNDQYMSWDVTYWANGAIFNRIPLLKFMKLREVFSFRGLYGKLKDQNNPANNPELFQFPTESLCQPMDKVPYMEAGVGLDNILTFLRLDYVWRLTYRNNPNINRGGVRVQLHFTF